MSTTLHQTVVTQHHTSSNSLNDPEWDNRLDALLEDLQSTVSVRGGGAVNGPQGTPAVAGSREIRTVRTVRTHTRTAGSTGTEVETIGSVPQIQYLSASNPTTVVSERAPSPINPELLAQQQKNASTTYKTVTYSYDKDGDTRVTTPVMPTGNAQLKQNLNELDNLLDDLNKADTTPRGTRRYEVVRTYTTHSSSKDGRDPGISLTGIDPGLTEEPVPQSHSTPIPPGRNQVTRTVKTYHYNTPLADPQPGPHTTTTYQYTLPSTDGTPGPHTTTTYQYTSPSTDGTPGPHRTSPIVPHTTTTVRSYTPGGKEPADLVLLPDTTGDTPREPGSTIVTYKYSTRTHSHTTTPEPRPYQAPPEPRPYQPSPQPYQTPPQPLQPPPQPYHPPTDSRPYQTPPSPKSYRVSDTDSLPYRTNRIPIPRSPTPPRELESPPPRSTPPRDIPSSTTPGSTVISYKYTTRTFHEPGTSPFPVSHSPQPPLEEPEPPHRPFPVSPSPQHPETEQKPPKRLDDLLASFSEPGREHEPRAPSVPTHVKPRDPPAHIPDAVDAEETDLLLVPQKKKEPKRPETKNVSGPPVYYPPGVDMFSKKDEPVKATMKGPGPKTKDDLIGDGGAVVPVCLPVCCAMPCVIM